MLKPDNIGVKKKILTVTYPMITTYTQHAHLLSILSSYECAYPWIFSNYIQLYINKDYKYSWGDFYFPFPYELRPSDTCKWILTQKIHRDIASSKWGTILNFIIECINSDNYIHTMINYFYVPISARFNKKELNHDIFIFGYDLTEEVLFVADFFCEKYIYERISFSDFDIAFSNYGFSKNSDYLNKLVYLYKFNLNCDYKFSIENIFNSIKSYLYSSIPEYWDKYNSDNKHEIVFGMEIYNTLINYIIGITSNKLHDIDVRPFYMLYDHKKIMVVRIKYLYNHQYCKNHSEENINKIVELEDQARIVLNLIIKYNITKNNVIINKVVNMLNDIEKKEKEILKYFI